MEVFCRGSFEALDTEGVELRCGKICRKGGRGHSHRRPPEEHKLVSLPRVTAGLKNRHVLHSEFWRMIGLKDPCSNDDQQDSDGCPHWCPLHDETGKVFCKGQLGHKLYTEDSSGGSYWAALDVSETERNFMGIFISL